MANYLEDGQVIVTPGTLSELKHVFVVGRPETLHGTVLASHMVSVADSVAGNDARFMLVLA